MLFLRGGNILIGLLLVPMTINYVDSTNYGIWLTLSSMVGWMSFFNIGLNNGLKNKLGDALAKHDYYKGKIYVSTTYAMLAIIFVPLMLILLIIVPYVDWHSFLNIPNTLGNSLNLSICILIIYFCIHFILSTINMVLHADQNPAGASSRDFVQQLLSLIIIWILTSTSQGSLLELCIALCLTPLLVCAIFNFTLFRTRYRNIAPSIKYINFSVAPELLNLGVKFFIIQIAGIIQYQMSNFLILRYIGANEVTYYNISYKYVSVLWMFWSIITTPIWVAVTDAIANNDYEWIKHTKRKYLRIFGVFSICGMAMLYFSPFVYKTWIGNSVHIPFYLTFFVLIYILVMMFGNIYVSILNGASQLNLQMYSCMVSPFIYFIVFYFCNKQLNFGVESVIITSILSNFNGFLIAPLQCEKLLKNKCI